MSTYYFTPISSAQIGTGMIKLLIKHRLCFHGTVENVKQIPDNPHLNFGMFCSEIPAPEDTRSLLFKRNMFCLHKALTNELLWVKQMTCELHRPQEDLTKVH